MVGDSSTKVVPLDLGPLRRLLSSYDNKAVKRRSQTAVALIGLQLNEFNYMQSVYDNFAKFAILLLSESYSVYNILKFSCCRRVIYLKSYT